jgi:hypothetical protein
MITGHTLQDDMEKCLDAVFSRGCQLLSPNGIERKDRHENKTRIAPTPLAANPRPVQLGGPTLGTG